MNSRREARPRSQFWILALLCLFLFGCERDSHRFKRYDKAISRAEEQYILGEGDPSIALARAEAVIDDAEKHLENGYEHSYFVHARVFTNLRKMKEAGLRNDLQGVERLAQYIEKLSNDENYPLRPPCGTGGRVDRQGAIRFITDWDRDCLQALKESKAAQSVKK
jgi:hypothetical protein